MTLSQDIIRDLKANIDSKVEQRKSILSQLALLDIQIDGYDSIIINMDKEAIGLISPINDSINSVKSSYEAVIDSGCKTDLAWVEVDRWSQLVQGGAGDGFSVYNVEYVRYEVQRNPSLRLETPYYGIKFYRKPSNRDYGSFIIAEFYGNVSQGSTIIAVTDEDGIPTEIQLDDYITDNIDSPVIFDSSSLPQVVGFGTTQSVGILTSLVGGIQDGSNIFAHFGAGSLVGVETGMILINPDILQENSYITGFGTTEISVDYYTSGGILTSGILTCNSVILDKPATDSIEEGDFNVGIVTISPSIYISTTASSTETSVLFTTFRSGDLDDIDRDFDPFGDPNTPVTIGVIDQSTLGVGHSVFYDNSGDPSGTQSYNPNKTYVDFSKESENSCLFEKNGTPRTKNVAWDEVNNQCIMNPEPKVGAGKAVYYESSDNWPVISNPIVNGSKTIVGYTNTYAQLGDSVTVASSSGITTGVNIGYVLYGPGGQCSSSQLNTFSSNITSNESTYQQIQNQNSTRASNIVESTKALRRQRSDKELYAWSLLQASSNLRKDIEVLQKEYSVLVAMDLGKYE